MSWFVSDANGEGGDFATNRGIMDLRRMPNLPDSVARFLDSGEVKDEAHKKAIVADCKGRPGLDYIAALLGPLTVPIDLSDGANDFAGEEDDDE